MHLAMKSLGFTENEKFVKKRIKKLNLVCEIRQKKYNARKKKLELKLIVKIY